jgi:hypothetical protein
LVCSCLGMYGAFEFAMKLEGGAVTYITLAAPVIARAAASIPVLAEATWRERAFLKSLLWWLALIPAGAVVFFSAAERVHVAKAGAQAERVALRSIVASMYIGNIMLLILNLPLIGLWVQVLKVPYRILFPLILLFCIIGVYSISNAIFDIYVMIGFGVLGYLMRKFGYEPAPLVLAFVLGPMMENNLRKSLILSDGSFGIFIEKPISLTCLVLALALLGSAIAPVLRARREKIALETS